MKLTLNFLKNNISPRLVNGGFFRFFSTFSLIYFLLFVGSCSEPDEIGMDFIEDTLDVEVLNIPVNPITIKGDSVPTNVSSRNLLGALNDPVFGTTTASIYTDFRLMERDINLGDDLKLDSVVLVMYYASEYYGDEGITYMIKVHELEEKIESEDGIFYSNFKYQYKENPAVEVLKHINPKDSVIVDSELVIPQLRINLPEEFGERLLDASGTEHFADNEAFIEFFKGFYIRVSKQISSLQSKGLIAYFDLVQPTNLTSYSNITLYYTSGDESKSQMFPISQNSNRLTSVDICYENANELLKKQIENNGEIDGEVSDSLIFLQSLSGVNILLEFPQIDSLAKEGNIIINKAKLILPVEDKDEFYLNYFPPPERILVLKREEDGDLSHIVDSNFDYFGGTYNEDDNKYEFNITQYFQELLENPESNRGVVLIPTRAHSNANRVVLRGPSHSKDPLKLKLLYTVMD